MFVYDWLKSRKKHSLLCHRWHTFRIDDVTMDDVTLWGKQQSIRPKRSFCHSGKFSCLKNDHEKTYSGKILCQKSIRLLFDFEKVVHYLVKCISRWWCTCRWHDCILIDGVPIPVAANWQKKSIINYRLFLVLYTLPTDVSFCLILDRASLAWWHLGLVNSVLIRGGSSRSDVQSCFILCAHGE